MLEMTKEEEIKEFIGLINENVFVEDVKIL